MASDRILLMEALVVLFGFVAIGFMVGCGL